MSASAIIWDWNGTLFGDVTAALGAINALLTRYALPPLTLEKYHEVFTFPVKAYYERIGFDFTVHDWQDVAAEFIALYAQTSVSSVLNPGAADAVALARSRGMRQVILSASRDDHLKAQVARFPALAGMEAVLGISDIYANSKQTLIADWLKRSGLRPGDVLLIGDTAHDAEVASACGCRCALHTLGHQPRSRLELTGAPVFGTLAECVEAAGDNSRLPKE